jgi:alkylated DNA repair protein (DNA oxidative demethylase)
LLGKRWRGTAMFEAEDGRQAILQSGFSYLPQFISTEEAKEMIDYFGALRPLWEQRFHGSSKQRSAKHGRRLTRPVYWLGAWQFACLGYYSEPEHLHNRCLRGEPFPSVMQNVLDRLTEVIASSHDHDNDSETSALPNTCLINYYGREIGQGQPRDYARLRMHRDGEPGPVIMFSIGQPGLLEFLDPEISADPELCLWTRHRSVSILSGPNFKDRLYHRITQVRTGREPQLHTELANFELRRISVSFRSVPEQYIADFNELPDNTTSQIADYVGELALHSKHYENQLAKK